MSENHLEWIDDLNIDGWYKLMAKYHLSDGWSMSCKSRKPFLDDSLTIGLLHCSTDGGDGDRSIDIANE